MPETTTSSAPLNPPSRVITASLVGTTIEFYDFYVYATAAVLVFPILFFPTGNDTTALLASFAVFGAAMVARPIGASSSATSVTGSGARRRSSPRCSRWASRRSSSAACPPTRIGWWAAPFLLLVLRLAQGFALGGEWSGAALVATENAPAGKRAWYGTFPQLGAPLGFIIANGVFLAHQLALPHPDGAAQRSEAFLAWGWRVPFLFSAVMVISACGCGCGWSSRETFAKAERRARSGSSRSARCSATTGGTSSSAPSSCWRPTCCST